MAQEHHFVARRNMLKGAAGLTGGIMLAGAAELAAGASAAAAAPEVHSRSAWGARPPRRAVTVLDRAPDRIVVHHTATANSSDLSLGHAFSLSRGIQNYHMDNNGWIDTGQQLTISRGGHVMEGRDRSLDAIGSLRHVQGAHVAGENSHTIGIENEGIYMTVGPTTRLWDSLVETCRWLCDVYTLDPQVAIVGHRDYNATACPGDVLYARLPELRNEVYMALGISSREPLTPFEPSGLPGPRHPLDHGPALSRREGG